MKEPEIVCRLPVTLETKGAKHWSGGNFTKREPAFLVLSDDALRALGKALLEIAGEEESK